jgi:hypothetical protein
MRKLLVSFLFVTTLLGCTAPLASACGDKVLVLGRGVKFGNIASSYHASIIAFVPDSVAQSAAVNDPRFQAALQKAGHKLRLVQQPDVLEQAVQSGKYDIILVDLQDAEIVDKEVAAAGVNTVVMPVVYDGPELKTAETAEFRCVRKTNGKDSSCFSTIDKAIETKLKRDELQRRAGN